MKAMRTIPLTQGKVALVDYEDWLKLSPYKWQYLSLGGRPSGGYAGRAIKGKTLYMHRVIMGNPLKTHIDHINHDKLDNRKANLRPATPSQNLFNQVKRTTNTSGYKGVGKQLSRGEWTGKWYARIQLNGKSIHLGRYATKEAAAVSYNEAARKHFGSFALLNGIEE